MAILSGRIGVASVYTDSKVYCYMAGRFSGTMKTIAVGITGYVATT